MKKTLINTPQHSGAGIFLLYTILIILIYSNTLLSDWQFDDYPNIIDNQSIHIDNLHPKTLWDSLFSKPFNPGEIERPISYFSFAINWFIGKDNPFGYHVVNIIIHIITTFYLFKSTFHLLESYNNTKTNYQIDTLYVAILSATLWAINPIQVQAVTYIVQRMASMAGMFYILSIYQYIRARQSNIKIETSIRIIISAFFFIIALGCKENSITLIPSLLIIELLFLCKKNDYQSRCYSNALISLNILFIFLGTIYLIKGNYIDFIFSNEVDRTFTNTERLLTQPRVLLFHISQLFFPSPTRFSLEHDFIISTSLLNPATTLLSISILISAITICLYKFNQFILINLAILFFLINHSIESTIIPLEMVFEHRNYIPSFFIFLPLAVFINRLTKHFSIEKKYFATTINSATVIIIIGISLGTYTRNQSWTTEETLWTDCLVKAPNSARPLARLAEIYGWKKDKNITNIQIATSLLLKSLEKNMARKSYKEKIINNIGKLHALNGDFNGAIKYYLESLDINPKFINSRYDLTQAYIVTGKFQEALHEINIINENSTPKRKFIETKGIILSHLHRLDESRYSFQQAMNLQKHNKQRYFYHLGTALTRTGSLTRGRWFLKLAYKNKPNDPKIIFSLIENYSLSNENLFARKYAKELVEKFSLVAIIGELEHNESSTLSILPNTNLVKKFVLEAAEQASVTF